jgi:hypothetical protein
MTSLNRLGGGSHPRLELYFNSLVTKVKSCPVKFTWEHSLLLVLNSDAVIINKMCGYVQ